MSRKYTTSGIVAGMTNALALALLLGAGAVQAQQTDAALQPVVTGTGNAFIDNAKAGYVFRTSYFDRRSAGDANGTGMFRQQAMGLGGWLYGNTGEIADILSFGGTYNFTVPLYSPGPGPNPANKFAYNYILRDPDQDSVSVIGEAYAKLRFGNHAAVLGRQSINQAWYLPDLVRFYNKLDQSMIGRRDVRAMHPIQYEAATVQGRVLDDTLRYYGGYIWNARQINDNHFRNIYAAAYQTTCGPMGTSPCATNAPNGAAYDSSGAYYAGVQWKPSNNMMLEGSWYGLQDMLNMAYLDFDYVFRMADKNYARLGVQYMYQGGNGANLVSGGNDFNTGYVGGYGELRLLPWLVPYGMVGWTANGDEIRAPYSIGPSYLVQRIGENSKAGERTWIIGSIFDFGPFGAKGLSFDVSYGNRNNRQTASYAGSTALPDWDELATDLVYVFPGEGFLKNFRTRLRYAKVKESGGTLVGDKFTDDLRWDFALTIPFK
ncbi:MAG: OprD family porin [Betaproteobacteria bacterium]|nr:OprD family porin [Betaproteobacteria bacterium]